MFDGFPGRNVMVEGHDTGKLLNLWHPGIIKRKMRS